MATVTIMWEPDIQDAPLDKEVEFTRTGEEGLGSSKTHLVLRAPSRPHHPLGLCIRVIESDSLP